MNKKTQKTNLIHKILIVLLILLAVGLFLEVKFAGSDWWQREFGKRAQQTKYVVVPQLEMEFDEDEAMQELNMLRRKMDQWMDRAVKRGHLSQHDLRFLRERFEPEVDLRETAADYIVVCDLPGMEKKDISISVKGNVLSIEGEREVIAAETKGDTHYYSERKSGAFNRAVVLPGKVDEQNITAEFKQGILTIKLPKLKENEESYARTVEII